MRRLRPVRDPATRFLIAVNVGVFVLQLYVGSPSWVRVEDLFGLTEGGLRSGALWQLLTYQFLHANELHILMNMLGLWFAGRELEPVIGTRRFVALYLIGGVVGGLAQMIFSSGPLIGASASVCAVLLALTSLFPNMPVMALIFFVLPLRMQARTLGLGMVGISILVWLSGLMPEVGHMAHLGGFATGWVFGLIYRRTLGEGGADFGQSIPPPLPGEGAFPRHDSMSFDDVLSKIMNQGIESLTRDERRILEEGRSTRRRR
jgi:membrane associated rhomboid family serine protease